ncbi:PASTA domain-containing protein [Streptomyces sp. NRRL F-5135]|uniref:PASTA domain-containing protein n=1 Tax=Streptomyces sp. NRRL F-5135 TaxID=1463858 RepID=UPI0007C59037|nr:PASTA domain-containing protein [Streptomyces sp. NRRL F-5135]
MKTRIGIAALACAAALTLAGCNPEPADSRNPATEAPPKEPASATPSATESQEAEPAAVPDFVGMGLQSAQDTAQAQGFYSLESHDSTGRARLQALDRNWKVCSQSVKAGRTVPVDTTLDFGTVKLEEECPAADEKEPEATGGKMPDLGGKSVKAARTALDPGTSITVTDANGDRMVLMESNWQVCTQDPSPGKALTGQPVELTAVKYEESCP